MESPYLTTREAAAYLRFESPPSERESRRANFSWDFSGVEMVRREVEIRWTPSLPAAPDLRQFLLAYLGFVHARLPTGTIQTL